MCPNPNPDCNLQSHRKFGGSARLIPGILLIIIFTSSMKTNRPEKNYTLLALGDSYTIGEAVPANQNFPSQTVEMLRNDGLPFADPLIVAETGWTTTDLHEAIGRSQLTGPYDFVTLLIGVNNQYSNGDSTRFHSEFENLVQQALSFTGNNRRHLCIVSIPDWSATRFAAGHLPDNFGRSIPDVSAEIDAYNHYCRAVADKYQIAFIDITPGTREAAKHPELLAPDGLHPSAIEYRIWAGKLAEMIKNNL